MSTVPKSKWYILVACIASSIPASGQPPVNKSPPLVCTIAGPPTCESGKLPAIAITVANWSDGDIHLVGSLDGSDCKWRYPHCYFEVIGPDGKPAVKNVLRCKFTNPLTETDFVAVPRGGKCDLGVGPAAQLPADIFGTEGEYRIRFVYSTDSADIKSWLGSGVASEKLGVLLAKVPKVAVSSNEITVKVGKPKKE